MPKGNATLARRKQARHGVDAAAVEALRDWMAEGAPPYSDGRTIVAAICERLNAAGVPVDRFHLFLFTIHPIVKGRRLRWDKGSPVEMRDVPSDLFKGEIYTRNPLPDVMKSRQSLRRRVLDPDCPDDYLIVGELRADGFTDYLCQPVVYIDGEVNTMSWATRARAGFGEDAIAALERIRAPMSRLVESYILRLNAANIISTYVGRNAGERVLKGAIDRGHAEEIEAAILFADLKGYTDFSNRHPVGDVLERLNRFYDALEKAIGSRGGEILKFMGDGLLAIFPVGRAGRKNLTREAAVEEAFAAVAGARAALGEATGFRSALHYGRLHYGNIGASHRLDFTAIGREVNLAARLLAAAAGLKRDDVCSQAVAGSAPDRWGMIAELELKGFAGLTPVYAPPSS
jgi:adenylate cyclase